MLTYKNQISQARSRAEIKTYFIVYVMAEH
jgi:hypothetical protein